VLLPSIWRTKTSFSFEVIVVDNGSTDGSAEWLLGEATKYQAEGKNFIFLKNSNTGYAKGNNLGIKIAKGECVLLLNPDTKLNPDTLQIMLDFMKSRPDVGISGCKLIKVDGTLDLACRRRFPNPANSFKRLFLRDNTNYNYSDISEGLEMEVDSVVGAFMLIRRSVIDKIGLLDESFFMYGEDLDYCWRCKEAGFKVWYVPKTCVFHYKGESSKKAPFLMLKAFHDSMWIFYKKHYAAKYAAPFNALVFTGIYLRMSALAALNLLRKEKYVSK
jgi:GT2 family glycosyltransferase